MEGVGNSRIAPQVLVSADFSIIERTPIAFSVCDAGRCLGMACTWLAPRHTRIARGVAQHGYREFPSRPVHFAGGLAKDGQEAHQFTITLMGLQCDQVVMIAPYLVALDDLGVTTFLHHLAIDASYYGDVLGDTRNVYTFGSSDPSRFFPFLIPSEPNTIGLRYTACVWRAVDGPVVSIRSSTFLVRWEKRFASVGQMVIGFIVNIPWLLPYQPKQP